MADKKGFDLADLLKDVSKLDTAPDAGREQIEYIDIGLIDSDPGNFYKLTQLEELASNIAVVGLQQPLRVRASENDPQRVVVVSGHRRLAALKLLIKEGREDLRAVPCIREHVAGSAALQELRLIFANRDTRVISSGEIAKQAERVEMLLYQLKEEGFEFPGRMRDYVAQACKISAPKLARLKVIRAQLIPEYMSLFEKDKLPDQTAYALARLPGDFQHRMFSTLPTVPSGDKAEKVLAKYNEGWRWEPQLTCPDGKACKRGDVFLRRDCEASGWQGFCGGNTCCLECDQAKASYSPCERMCSKAKAQRKEASDKEKEEEHKRLAKQGRKYQKETQGYAKRLLRAIDAAGVPEDTKINWRHYDGAPVSTIRQWAAGEFNSDPARWYDVKLKPGTCYSDHLADNAKLLNCSTDFLMGLTEDIRPATVQEEPEDPIEALEEETASADSWDDISEALDQVAVPEPARRIRWESRCMTPPTGKPILTYQMTNNGPEYRPAMWDGSKFQSPDHRKELAGLQYTHWLEVPLPGSGESCEVARPEQGEGQLMICGWMPGGTTPSEPCDIVADFTLDDSKERRLLCYFDGAGYRFSSTGASIDSEVIRWMRLPPVE